MPRHSLKIQLNLEGTKHSEKLNNLQINMIPLKSIRFILNYNLIFYINI
jgi:hypothetical protein